MAGTTYAKTRRLFMLSVVVALIAGAQDRFQLLYKQRRFGDAESFDLVTDVSAAAPGLMTQWA